MLEAIERRPTQLHVQCIGAGPPCIVLHGWGHSGKDLQGFADLLAHDYQVHLVDLPGFGQSPAPDSAWGAGDYAACIAEYIQENSLGPVRLIGHSFGGKVSATLAAQYPELVTCLVLVNSSGLKRKRPPSSRLRMRAIGLLGRGIRAVSPEKFEEWFVPRYGSTDYQQAGNLRPILVKAVNEDIETLLPRIRVPALLLWGGRDEETPPEIGKRMRRLIPRSCLVILPHKGHNMLRDSGGHLCLYHMKAFLEAGGFEACSG